MSAAHAVLAPSSAARWVQCPGSVRMQQQYPEREDDPRAAEGTAAHWVVSEMLQGVIVPLGARAPNGVEVTDEMLDGAEIYADDVRALQLPPEHPVKIEERVDIPGVHAECWGTPDTWLYRPKHEVIHVWDYKFGHGHVSAFENWQLVAYASGILSYLDVDGLRDQHTRVVLRVVQPRDFHPDGPVREWVVKASDLRGYVNTLRHAAESAMLPDAPCKTGPECDYCTARHACTALQSEALAVVPRAFESMPFDLPSPALGRELAVLEHAAGLIKARMTGLTAEALARAKAGERVPGWTLAAGQGREKWAKPLEEVVALGEMMGVNVSKPGAITPKQAIKAGLPAELVRAYSETPVGEVKLVRDTGTALRLAFSKEQ